MAAINSYSSVQLNELTLLERLPNETVGEILTQLVDITGTKGIVNDADIPVIMRYMRNLACTSKRMNALVNDLQLTQVFLKALADKYHRTPEDLAAQFNTLGARRWIWDYAKRNGDDKVYQTIRAILKLATKICKEMKKTDPSFDISVLNSASIRPNDDQIQRGFLLYNHYRSFEPSHLVTPFGVIDIFSGGILRGGGIFSPCSFSRFGPLILETLIKRLHATFERVSADGFDVERMNFYDPFDELNRGRDTYQYEELSKLEMKSRIGTHHLVLPSHDSSYSVYQLRQVRKKVLPNVTRYESRKFYRSSTLITIIWAMLERDRLGKDPILQKSRKRDAVKESNKVENPFFGNLSEVAKWGTDLVKLLAEKREKQRMYDLPEKELVLKDYQKAQLLEQLNEAARIFLKKNSEWCIEASKTDGGILRLRSSAPDKPCDLKTLGLAYDSVIKSVSLSWVRSKLKDYPTLLHRESEEEYFFFVKKENILNSGNVLHSEDKLLGLFAIQSGISNFMSCHNNWKYEAPFDLLLYLWVRKDKLEKVIDVLNLKFNL